MPLAQLAATRRVLGAALVDNKKLKLEAKKVGKDRKDYEGDEDMDGEDEQDDDEHERVQKRWVQVVVGRWVRQILTRRASLAML